MNAITALFDNTYFRIFFAAWTGFYLWQIIIGEEGAQFTDFAWMVAGFVAAMVLLGPAVTQGSNS